MPPKTGGPKTPPGSPGKARMSPKEKKSAGTAPKTKSSALKAKPRAPQGVASPPKARVSTAADAGVRNPKSRASSNPRNRGSKASTPSGPRSQPSAPLPRNGFIRFVEVTIVRAYDVAAADTTGKSDPYVTVSGDGRIPFDYEVKTPYIEQTLNPVWNNTFKLPCVGKPNMSTTINFTVYDFDKFNDNDFLGYAEINITPNQMERMIGCAKSYMLKLDARPGNKREDRALVKENDGYLGELEILVRPLANDYKLPASHYLHSFAVTLCATDGLKTKKKTFDTYAGLRVRGVLAAGQKKDVKTATQKGVRNGSWGERFEFFAPSVGGPVADSPRALATSASAQQLAAGKAHVLVVDVYEAAAKEGALPGFLGQAQIRVTDAQMRDAVGKPMQKKIKLGSGDTKEGEALVKKHKAEIGYVMLEIRAAAGKEAPPGRAPQKLRPEGKEQKEEDEKRMDVTDGNFYPLGSFLEFYGGRVEWDTAPRLRDCEGLSKEEILKIREAEIRHLQELDAEKKRLAKEAEEEAAAAAAAAAAGEEEEEKEEEEEEVGV
eukprot:Rhum_TRINITY_DN8525_c0_g1::Rhum_TRINITY_DN8525_c0_g1_i1::g.28542::m.28542